MPDEKPLFIALRAVHFEEFAAGTKTEEYRKIGGPWNARTCRVGRAVVLSRGYGKHARLRGVVTGYREGLPLDLAAFHGIYGPDAGNNAACIAIKTLGEVFCG